MTASSEAEHAGKSAAAGKIEPEATALAAGSEAPTSGVKRPPPQHPDYVAPRSPLEAELADIVKEVLQVEKVGVHDNFFTLGGDSMTGIQVVARARSAGINVTLEQLFERQTIAGLTGWIAKQGASFELQGFPSSSFGDESESTAKDELTTSDLKALTETSIDRIESHLRALQTGFSSIESKFETLGS